MASRHPQLSQYRFSVISKIQSRWRLPSYAVFLVKIVLEFFLNNFPSSKDFIRFSKARYLSFVNVKFE